MQEDAGVGRSGKQELGAGSAGDDRTGDAAEQTRVFGLPLNIKALATATVEAAAAAAEAKRQPIQLIHDTGF
jgi:hypothetical protein